MEKHVHAPKAHCLLQMPKLFLPAFEFADLVLEEFQHRLTTVSVLRLLNPR